ncbi:unnamed protein product [Ilex paraguariensis]|uniref:DOG1 domain-containing protein n=1 Tax=Ilex paraguariensis TaxID=185542 RepID=A0ABC8TPQ5_9AQUA
MAFGAFFLNVHPCKSLSRLMRRETPFPPSPRTSVISTPTYPNPEARASLVSALLFLSSLPKKKTTQEHVQESRLPKMFKAVAFFGRKKTTRPFKDYYTDWFNTLKNTLLPQLRRSMSLSSSTLLSTHVEMIHNHFQTYYETLDLAASNDVAQLLFPEWRTTLEKPFLWLGDFHPYLFTNLLRSFLDDQDTDDEEETESVIQIGESSEFFDKPWNIVMAWKTPSNTLMAKIDQIECGLRLMVPALVARARQVQAEFVERVGVEWGKCEGRKEGVEMAVGKAVVAEMEEMMSVFMDANRLRRSVLTEILNITNVYQAALFLEGLAQFLIGFRDHAILSEFERSKMAIN